MTKQEQKRQEEIYASYRETLGRPDLTPEEIEEMRIPMKIIAEAVYDYLEKEIEKNRNSTKEKG